MPNYSSFKIRSYGRMELASLYSPDLTGMSAYRKLMRWIDRCKDLRQQLDALGYQPGRRTFTPLERGSPR